MANKRIDLSNFGVAGECTFEVYKKGDNDGELQIISNVAPKTKEEIISILTLNDELNNFFKKNLELISKTTEKLIREGVYSTSEDIKPLFKYVIQRNFIKHLKEQEIEILCRIEREKSPYYPSTYRIVYKKR